jgi:hypothetical protein
MELADFVSQISNFSARTHSEKIKIFGWYLRTHRKKERFTLAEVRGCYDALDLLLSPNMSTEFTRLVEKRELLKNAQGYSLERRVSEQLTAQYGEHETTIAVTKLLAELPGKIADDAERTFLQEALTCYRHRAMRAAIVMSWNLAYDHLVRWVLKDPKRLTDFNANIPGRIGATRAAKVTIVEREDFEKLTEKEVIDICGSAGLFSSHNIKQILETQLTKRNMAAHPSLVEIGPAQADDAITSLVNNVVLKLV